MLFTGQSRIKVNMSMMRVVTFSADSQKIYSKLLINNNHFLRVLFNILAILSKSKGHSTLKR